MQRRRAPSMAANSHRRHHGGGLHGAAGVAVLLAVLLSTAEALPAVQPLLLQAAAAAGSAANNALEAPLHLQRLSDDELAHYLSSLHSNSTVLNTELLSEPALSWTGAGHHGGRALRAAAQAYPADWIAKGRYVEMRNPSMPDGRSSTGQVAIHAVLLPRSYKVLIFGRNLPKSGPKSIPEPRVGGNVSVVFDVSTGDYVVTPNYETLFCAGHTTMPDGQVLAAGGDPGVGYSWMREGRDVVRLFDPASMAWKTLPGVKLSEPRWYPTQVNLPDDRVIIVSGFLDDPARQTGKPAPSIDVYDHKSRSITIRKSRYDLGKSFFTNITPGYQLYPVVFLINWRDPAAPGDYFLFMYTCRTGQIVRFTAAGDFIPMHTMPGLPIENMCSSFSAMGSAVILPLRPSADYAFEVAIFGGGTQGKGMDCKGVCNAPAADTIFRYRLPTLRAALAGNWATDWVWSGNAKWETMPSPRVFADAVLLPNGEVAVLNGARYGVPGGGIDGGSTAKGGAFTAMLYIPDAPVGERMRNLGTSGIHRYYHSNALLLPSGDIWVAGSEQGDCVDTCATGGRSPPDQEYRAELLQLPYAFQARPEITAIARDTVRFGETLKISINPSVGGYVSTASVIPPGSNTHSLNMMQRVVFLKIVDRSPSHVTVQLPAATDRVLNPGWHMLFVNSDKRIPCREAKWLRITL